MSNQLEEDEIKKYLVTQKSDVDSFSQEKINKDLSLIKKQEERTKKKVDISVGVRDKQVGRAMGALSLINPFKGV